MSFCTIHRLADYEIMERGHDSFNARKETEEPDQNKTGECLNSACQDDATNQEVNLQI